MATISSKDTILIFGGTGFIGSYLIRRLAKTHAKIILACRNVESNSSVKICGAVGQISLLKINTNNLQEIDNAVAKANYVINLVGIMFEDKKNKFMSIHATLAHNIAKSSSKHRVKSLVHMSALGTDRAKTSRYAASKSQGEKLVLQAYPNAIIIRPSVVFGPEDKFINLFHKISKLSPFIPLIGGGHAKMQPVYVADVAEAISLALCIEPSATTSRILELAGPKIYSLYSLISYIVRCSNLNRVFLHIPFSIAKLTAILLQYLPSPIFTVDQVELLKYDNILHGKNGLKELGIKPTPLEAIVPSYIN